MGKIYEVQSVNSNHDWDFSVDSEGNITKLVVRAIVNLGDRSWQEQLDIWPELNPGQKETMQLTFDRVREWFDTQFVG